MEIITTEIVCSNTPLNAQVLQKDQLEKCKKIVFEINLITLLGIECLTKIQDETEGLEPKWLTLKADFSQNGGGLLLTLSWLIYLEWLRKYGEAQITTKGLKVRNDDFTSTSDKDTFKRMVADAENTAIKFLEKTKEFLYKNNDTYNCVEKITNCDCKDSKTTIYLPNFSVS